MKSVTVAVQLPPFEMKSVTKYQLRNVMITVINGKR